MGPARRHEKSVRFNQSPLFKNPAAIDSTFTFVINNTRHTSGLYINCQLDALTIIYS